MNESYGHVKRNKGPFHICLSSVLYFTPGPDPGILSLLFFGPLCGLFLFICLFVCCLFDCWCVKAWRGCFFFPVSWKRSGWGIGIEIGIGGQGGHAFFFPSFSVPPPSRLSGMLVDTMSTKEEIGEG